MKILPATTQGDPDIGYGSAAVCMPDKENTAAGLLETTAAHTRKPKNYMFNKTKKRYLKEFSLTRIWGDILPAAALGKQDNLCYCTYVSLLSNKPCRIPAALY